MQLTKPQYQLLASFLNDTAKGLFLGAFITQPFAQGLPPLTRISLTLPHLGVALLFLYTALESINKAKT